MWRLCVMMSRSRNPRQYVGQLHHAVCLPLGRVEDRLVEALLGGHVVRLVDERERGVPTGVEEGKIGGGC